ncbi:MAG: hypothetical protein ABJL67_02740 [Sulfitobacter sp.]
MAAPSGHLRRLTGPHHIHPCSAPSVKSRDETAPPPLHPPEGRDILNAPPVAQSAADGATFHRQHKASQSHPRFDSLPLLIGAVDYSGQKTGGKRLRMGAFRATTAGRNKGVAAHVPP